MIEKIINAIRERRDSLVDSFKGDTFSRDIEILHRIHETEDIEKIVQKVAKEYGKDTNVRSNGWIPCEVEYPKENTTVLTIDSEGNMEVLDYDINWKNSFSKYGGNLRVFNVEAWQPLPAPYQKGEKKQYCSTCCYYALVEGVCCNGKSEHCADFRCLDDSCEYWKQKGE